MKNLNRYADAWSRGVRNGILVALHRDPGPANRRVAGVDAFGLGPFGLEPFGLEPACLSSCAPPYEKREAAQQHARHQEAQSRLWGGSCRNDDVVGEPFARVRIAFEG